MKFKSLFLLVTSTITLACTAATVNKEKYFEKTENNKSGYTKDISKSDLGYWSIKDCKLLSDGVGEMVGITGYLLEESSQMRDSGNDKGSDEMFEVAERTSAVSANLATTFSAFCK
jgi:hypothetical protein|tara:strand:+ start:13397 stop:13744 length:348 start_codon:yes stop_codon:yes gene_type:complete